MTQAPSIKEALVNLVASIEAERLDAAKWETFHQRVAEAKTALATFPPSGEGREAIARIIHPNGFDSAGIEFEHAAEVEEAFRKADLILASGLVQDEAGWRDSGTIPMDGTNVLIAEDHRGSSGEAYYDAEEGRWYWANTGRGDYPTPHEPFPTHWKPLPAPPPIRSARDGGATCKERLQVRSGGDNV